MSRSPVSCLACLHGCDGKIIKSFLCLLSSLLHFYLVCNFYTPIFVIVIFVLCMSMVPVATSYAVKFDILVERNARRMSIVYSAAEQRGHRD